ncbi:7-deoxyloganetin glucosyltransferase-like [Pistacia vera]|uniref:7-deoxyloganetin glucosyltransferase-like n=1 Tax=Pistacia vera TaxID=55513 RepID=UPI0012638DAF|nr:7-deoxyloganetin glucosyltransferase-like [Pistacia vera]
MDLNSVADKPHAICMPYPAQGHINPMFKLAKLLHLKGFHITFVNTEYNHRRLLKSRGPNHLEGLLDFRFETIPDGLPFNDADVTQDIPSLCDSTSKYCFAPFCNLIRKLNDTSSSKVPPVTCIVSDGSMSFTVDAAEEFGIPDVLFWTPSASGLLCYTQFHLLVERVLTPLKDVSYLTNEYLETTVDWIPGMKSIRLRDFPAFIRTTDANDIMVNYIIREVQKASKASAIVLNTFDSLEQAVLDALSVLLPPIYTIGSLPLLTRQIGDGNLNFNLSLWKEQFDTIEWLDSKEPGSVVYVNFGSITVMTPEQLTEFAWGLANSRMQFLWIIRPDLVAGDSAILAPEFLTETKDRGMLASWCPQEKVLNHPSVGGFLSHMGWNSTIESICNGIPMVCWPFFAEQQTNCMYACNEWGIGLEIDNNVKRDEVEKLVRELMHGEKGKEMKKRAVEWQLKAEKASAPAGSSYQNLEKLIAQVLLEKHIN